jgi:hypothetical protein
MEIKTGMEMERETDREWLCFAKKNPYGALIPKAPYVCMDNPCQITAQVPTAQRIVAMSLVENNDIQNFIGL